MAFRLYVGNYPSTFTRKDVENLFRDFDGITVDKICASKSKSFSFLNCKDIDQLMSVIKKMNRASVSGRNLVVRASDSRLQEYVDLILQNDELPSPDKALSSPSESPFVPVQVMRNKFRQPHAKNDSEKSGSNVHNKSGANNFQKRFPKSYDDGEVSENKSTCSSRSMHNIYQHKQDVSETSAYDSSLLSKTPDKVNNQLSPRSNNESHKNNTHSSKNPLNSYQTVNHKNEHEYFETDSIHSPGSLQKSYHQAAKQINNDFPENTSPESHIYGQPKCERYSHDQIKNSYNKNEHEYFETDYIHFPGSLQKSYHQAAKQINNDFPENTSPESHTYGQPKRESYSHDQIKNSYNKNEHEYYETDSIHSPGSLQKSYHRAAKQINNDFPENTSPESMYSQPKRERYSHDQIKTSNTSCSGYSYNNNTSDINSHASRDMGIFSHHRDSSSPTWVSVTNFRIGTYAKALYELFSDYSPLKVKMICNVPRKDKTLCEAHICFPNKDIADDVILNFDNTIFEGRIILVNDVEDLTIMNELLNVSLS